MTETERPDGRIRTSGTTRRVRVCLQCGDRGFSNALVYCEKCDKCVIHKYCLDVLPADFDEYVFWFCDDCEDKVPIKSIIKKKTAESNKENSENSRKDVSNSTINAPNFQNFEMIKKAQPIIDPIWRGDFDIHTEKRDKLEGLVAHLSNRTCQKVYEESKLLYSPLSLEMLPRSDVWPKSFQGIDPSDEQIGLYFFPSGKRYEREFDDLVHNMIAENQALRAQTKHAELLIFSSTELKSLYWRYNGKYFLWGTFRGKKGSENAKV